MHNNAAVHNAVHNDAHGNDAHPHTMSPGMYYGIWITLMVLTVVTAAVSFIDLGPMNTVVALSIATFKAILVVLFFMHVKYADEKLVKLVIASAIFFLILLLSLSMIDYLTRYLA